MKTTLNAVLFLYLSLASGWTPMAFAAGPAEETVLSADGSGRATAYAEQAKIITLGDKTHVVWLDADKDGFHVRGRTLDRASGCWSSVVTIGAAQDNHGGPGLTVDSKGYLHVVYYPHHGAFRYRQSARPNDLSAWGPEIQFGEGLSFPSMLCAPDDTLILSARRGFHDAQGNPIESQPVEQELWKKPPGGEWQRRATLLRSRHPGYAQFAVSLAWGADHRTIHLGCRIYEGNPYTMNKPISTIAYMVSPDEGETWTQADGSPLALPATVDTIDVVAADGGEFGPRLNSGPLAVDAAGTPHLVYSAELRGKGRMYLATPAPGLGWTRRELNPYLPKGWEDYSLILTMGGGISFSASGRATIVAIVFKLTPEEAAGNPDSRDSLLKTWGHRSCEIVRFWSEDGLKNFQSEILSPTDPKEPHWLPNIERATGHNRVPDEPGIIYMAGDKGENLVSRELRNRVIWQPKG